MRTRNGIRFATIILIAVLMINHAAASQIKDLFAFSDHTPIRFSIQAQIIKTPQYDEIRTENLNRLMQHFSFNGFIDACESELDVLLDEHVLFSCIERKNSGKTDLILIPDNDHAFLIPKDTDLMITSEGLSFESLDSVMRNREILLSLEEIRSFLEKLPQLFPDHASEAKILERYRYYGTAVKKVSVSLSGEELNQAIREQDNTFTEFNMFPDFRELIFLNRQTFTLLYTEDEQLIKINYSGKAGLSEEDLRNIRLEWKTVRTDLLEKDELLLKTPNENKTRRYNVLLEHTLEKPDDGSEHFLWNAEIDRLWDGIRTQKFTICDLSVAEGMISGKFTETVKENRDISETETEITISAPSPECYSGTLEIIGKKDKIEKNRLAICFWLDKSANVQPGSNQEDPAAVTKEEYDCIQKGLLSSILQELLKLPEDDLIFLSEGIPDDIWNSIKTQPVSSKEPEK